MTHEPYSSFTDDSLSLLGTYTDASIARHLRVSRYLVARVRKELGRPRGRLALDVAWTDADLAVLGGPLTDTAAAHVLAVPPHRVVRERLRLFGAHYPRKRGRPAVEWTPDRLAVLEYSTDREVAAALGCSPQTVRTKRKSLGLPGVKPFKGRVWTDAELALLGTTTDAAVAAELGLHPTTVAAARRKLTAAANHIPT